MAAPGSYCEWVYFGIEQERRNSIADTLEYVF